MEACIQRDQNFPGFSPQKTKAFLGFDVLKAEMQKFRIFEDVTLCRWMSLSRRYNERIVAQSTRVKLFEVVDLKMKATRFFKTLATTQPTTKGYS